jgi:hypothetical protein
MPRFVSGARVLREPRVGFDACRHHHERGPDQRDVVVTGVAQSGLYDRGANSVLVDNEDVEGSSIS